MWARGKGNECNAAPQQLRGVSVLVLPSSSWFTPRAVAFLTNLRAPQQLTEHHGPPIHHEYDVGLFSKVA